MAHKSTRRRWRGRFGARACHDSRDAPPADDRAAARRTPRALRVRADRTPAGAVGRLFARTRSGRPAHAARRLDGGRRGRRHGLDRRRRGRERPVQDRAARRLRRAAQRRDGPGRGARLRTESDESPSSPRSSSASCAPAARRSARPSSTIRSVSSRASASTCRSRARSPRGRSSICGWSRIRRRRTIRGTSSGSWRRSCIAGNAADGVHSGLPAFCPRRLRR